jgi:hypothetical protein
MKRVFILKIIRIMKKGPKSCNHRRSQRSGVIMVQRSVQRSVQARLKINKSEPCVVTCGNRKTVRGDLRR